MYMVTELILSDTGFSFIFVFIGLTLDGCNDSAEFQ